MRSVRQSGVHLAPPELSYSTQPQSVEVEITRNPASQYLLLDSKDRIQSSTPNAVNLQPWNDFKLQRPQSLMETFATRIGVSEIRFPWFIPNITSNNNTIVYVGYKIGSTELVAYDIVVPVGFYNPNDLVTYLNNEIVALNLQYPITISYNQINSQYVFNPSATSAQLETAPYITISFNENIPYDPVTEFQYYNNPSLALTMGIPYDSLLSQTPVSEPYNSEPTETLYTQYVDIISNKYNQYTTNLDGNSFSSGSNRLLCRLYLADEVSVGNNYAELYQPFLIHRQFKNPKMVMWNKDSVIDWLDISVVDQYNRLVPLPKITVPETPTTTIEVDGSYPNFQITLLATEN
jgi:hypothetical protein